MRGLWCDLTQVFENVYCRRRSIPIGIIAGSRLRRFAARSPLRAATAALSPVRPLPAGLFPEMSISVDSGQPAMLGNKWASASCRQIRSPFFGVDDGRALRRNDASIAFRTDIETAHGAGSQQYPECDASALSPHRRRHRNRNDDVERTGLAVSQDRLRPPVLVGRRD